MARKVEIRTRKQALQRVASYIAGELNAGTLEEVSGLSQQEQDAMSEAELGRLDWAMEEVQRRLYRMGGE